MAYDFNKLEKMYKASGISKATGIPSRPTPAKPTPALVPTRPTPEKVAITPVNDEPIVHNIPYEPIKMQPTPEKPHIEAGILSRPTPEKPIIEPTRFAPGTVEIGGDTRIQYSAEKPSLGFDKALTSPANPDIKIGLDPIEMTATPEKEGRGGEWGDWSGIKIPKQDFVYRSLREEAKRNNQRSQLWGNQPFLQRGIQRSFDWSTFHEDNPSGLLGKINWLTAPLLDTLRVAKYMVSPKGLLFNLKQFGLQLTNPKGEFPIALHANRIYNPLSVALQVPANLIGVHMDRHFLGPLNPQDIKYENLATNLNTGMAYKMTNRLVQVGQELEVGLFESKKKLLPPAIKGLMAVYTKFTSFLNKLKGQNGIEIKTLSGLMGPNSFFGIGSTPIFTSTSGIKRAPIFLYTPDDPYDSFKAAQHYDEGKWSEASLGSENTDLTLNPHVDKLHLPGALSSVEWEDEWGNEFHTGFVDVGGVNLGEFLTSTYEELSKKISNDARDNTYGNPDLESWDQSKFGPSGDVPEEGPVATTNLGVELPINPPANSGETEVGNAETEFDVFSYTDIAAFSKARKQFRDFRNKDAEDSYNEGQDSVTRIGLTDLGTVEGGEASNADTDFASDFVKVEIAGIPFRAYIEELDDGFSVAWTETQYAGNPGHAYQFDKFGRTWSIKLKVPAFSVGELKNNYKNLNLLLQASAPKIISGVAGGQFHKITVGDLWVDKDIIIDSIKPTYNIKSWDIALGEADKETSGLELPMHFDIAIGGKFLVNADGIIWNNEGKFFGESILAD